MKTYRTQTAALLIVLIACSSQQVATAEFDSSACPISPRERALQGGTRRDQCPENRYERAGYPHCVAPWAKFSYGPKYKSYYVGGSQAPCRPTPAVCKHPRCIHEGTWGTDYAPWYSKVQLLWTHGQLYQDGGGQYEPDHRNYPFKIRFAGPHHEHHPHKHVPHGGHAEPYEHVEPLGESAGEHSHDGPSLHY